MTRLRAVEPEWLDTLPRESPDAAQSRRDLKRLNRWMLQAGIMAGLADRVTNDGAPRIVVDLGAGDGTFLLALARRMAPGWGDVRAILVDRQDLLSEATRGGFEAVGWRVEAKAMDAFAFLSRARPGGADLVVANLFLHHFERRELGRLLHLAARMSPRFAACEPRRSHLALAASRAVGVLGCNRVTRHDAVASVRAGFEDGELSALWPTGGGWRLREGAAGLFTHGFTARHGA